jgi:hypothetical protein
VADLSDPKAFLAKIKELPQGKHIKEDDAIAWHESVMQYDKERIDWHFERLKGLGGSDVGEIAAWKLGVFNAFKTPRDIIDEKLLRKPIEPPNNNMRRGTYLEPTIQRIFLEDFNAVSREDLIEKINNQRDPDHPWMRGNVDDVTEIGGEIFIVDYKAPKEAKDKTSVQYAAQVHQYGHLYELAVGEKPFSHLVGSFDYANGKVNPVEVPFDETIMNAVLEGGDEIWGHVLEGTYPDYPDYKVIEKSSVEYTPEELAQIEHLEEECLRYKLIAEEADKQSKAMTRKLYEVASRGGEILLKDEKPPLEVMTASIRQKMDESAALQILQNAGVDTTEYYKQGKKLDEDKAIEALADHYGEDSLPDFYQYELDSKKVLELCKEKGIAPPVTETFSVSFNAKKKSLDKEAVANAKAGAVTIVEQGAQSLNLGDNDQDDNFSPSAA